MKKHILLLSLAACACASTYTSYTLGKKNRVKRVKAQKIYSPVASSTPPQTSFKESVPVEKGVEVKLSDKTIVVTKEQAEKLCSRKIDGSGISYSSSPEPVELLAMDSKSFEFMQKLTDLSAQKLFTFLDNATSQMFNLIRFYANELQLEGKFKTACHIKMLQDPAQYGKDEIWQGLMVSEFCDATINQSGTRDSQWKSIPETYLGYWRDSDHYRNTVVKQDGQDWPEYQLRWEKEQHRVSKIHTAVHMITAHINYHQGVFQAPAPLKTDFLKECFYKLDIAHQNKLINNNLVTLS